jgi:hypothetical protein
MRNCHINSIAPKRPTIWLLVEGMPAHRACGAQQRLGDAAAAQVECASPCRRRRLHGTIQRLGAAVNGSRAEAEEAVTLCCGGTVAQLCMRVPR